VLQDVLNSVVKLLLTSAGGSGGGGLDDIFGSLLGSLFDGGGAAAPAGVSPEIGANFAGITHFAGGGDFGAGQLAMVGENGPELVQFGRAGHVFPTGTGIRSGGGTVITIDLRGADLAAVARIERALDSLHRNFEQRSITAVNGQRKRGGSFAASFRR
jgi:hypothetical protein